MKAIGIQFQDTFARLACFKNKNELVGVTVPLNDTLETAVAKLMEEADISFNKNTRIVLSLPNRLVRVNTLLKTPNVGKTKNIKEILIMEAESQLDLNQADFIISPALGESGNDKDTWQMSVAAVPKSEATVYAGAVTANKLKLAGIDIEAEALRRMCGPAKDRVILYFFEDGQEYVGIFIYKADFLIGIRYLPTLSYDAESLKTEIDRMISYCKQTYRDYQPEEYVVFSQQEENVLYMKEVLPDIQDNPWQNNVYAVAGGLALWSQNENFNLLPPEFYPAKPDYKKAAFIGGNLVLIAALVVSYNLMSRKINKVIHDAAVIQNQIQNVNQQVAAIKNNLDQDPLYIQLKSPNDPWSILPPLNHKEFQYGDFMLLLSNITPKEVKISGLTSDAEAVHVLGQAKKYEDIVQLYRNLEQLNLFYSLRFYKMQVLLDKNVIVFDLGGLLKDENNTQAKEDNKSNANASTAQASTPQQNNAQQSQGTEKQGANNSSAKTPATNTTTAPATTAPTNTAH